MNAWNAQNENSEAQLTPSDALVADLPPESDNLPGESFTGPDEGTQLDSPGTDIVVPEEIEIDVPENPEQKVTRFGRAAEVYNGEVVNVLRVVIDEDNNVVGYQSEDGVELIVLDEDARVGPGFFHIDGEFVDPDAE